MKLDGARVVLVGTTHPGNIGATARAMNTMGLERLVLVRPECDPASPEAVARAAGSEALIEAATCVEDLDTAVADCRTVFGLTARPRSDGVEPMELRPAARRAVGEGQGAQVAWVFGQERAGLSNRDLDYCDHAVRIPANPEYASLNVAQAVQLVAWEYRMAVREALSDPEPAAGEGPRRAQDQAATAQEMEGMFAHLEAVCDAVGYLHRHNPELLMRRMRRLLRRARPSQGEIHMLRGLFSHVLDARRWRRK